MNCVPRRHLPMMNTVRRSERMARSDEIHRARFMASFRQLPASAIARLNSKTASHPTGLPKSKRLKRDSRGCDEMPGGLVTHQLLEKPGYCRVFSPWRRLTKSTGKLLICQHAAAEEFTEHPEFQGDTAAPPIPLVSRQAVFFRWLQGFHCTIPASCPVGGDLKTLLPFEMIDVVDFLREQVCLIDR